MAWYPLCPARIDLQEEAELVLGKELVLCDLERSGRVFVGQSVNQALLTGLANTTFSLPSWEKPQLTGTETMPWCGGEQLEKKSLMKLLEKKLLMKLLKF